MSEQELKSELMRKATKQTTLEIAKIDREIATLDDAPTLWSWFKTAVAYLKEHIATLTIAVSAIVAVLTYQQSLSQNERDRFNLLVDRLLTHRDVSKRYDELVAMSTLVAIRSEYAKNPVYATEVAFLVLPYVFLGKSKEDLRLLAARTEIEAVESIRDIDEFYRLGSKFKEVVQQGLDDVNDMTPNFFGYSKGLTCAFTRASHRLNVPNKGDLSYCEDIDPHTLLPR